MSGIFSETSLSRSPDGWLLTDCSTLQLFGFCNHKRKKILRKHPINMKSYPCKLNLQLSLSKQSVIIMHQCKFHHLPMRVWVIQNKFVQVIKIYPLTCFQLVFNTLDTHFTIANLLANWQLLLPKISLIPIFSPPTYRKLSPSLTNINKY